MTFYMFQGNAGNPRMSSRCEGQDVGVVRKSTLWNQIAELLNICDCAVAVQLQNKFSMDLSNIEELGQLVQL